MNNSKFKIGDRVTKLDGSVWNMGDGVKLDYRTVRTVEPLLFGEGNKHYLSKTEDSKDYSTTCWYDNEIKLYEEPKVEDKPKKVVELTYVELLSYLTKEGKDGEKWIPKKLDSRSTGIIEYIAFINKTITIKHRRGIQTVHLSIDSSSTYVREELKSIYRIYQVEHQESGKRYDFGREFLCYARPLEIQDIVVCSTKYGHTYGKIVDYNDIEMTESEYNEYSKIIKRV